MTGPASGGIGAFSRARPANHAAPTSAADSGSPLAIAVDRRRSRAAQAGRAAAAIVSADKPTAPIHAAAWPAGVSIQT